MVECWLKGGAVRKELLKRWWDNPNVAAVKTEIVLADQHLEPAAQILHAPDCNWHV